jgi:hypothetical protein
MMRKLITITTAVAALTVPSLAMADTNNGGQTSITPVAGPGCFGQWRAGSVQYLNSIGAGPVGENYFAVRAGDNSTINADNRAECAAL